jgi:hypothetical protein
MAVLSSNHSIENVQKMKCTENIREIDYYNEILSYFEKTTGENVFVFDQNDKWVDYSYLHLMRELRSDKVLLDADIGDVTKNCLILILSLIEMKKKPRGTPFQCCSDEDQVEIKHSLANVLV